MKKNTLVTFVAILILHSSTNVCAQLTINHIYTSDAPQNAVKLSSGLKYYSAHSVLAGPTYTTLYFVLYNPDHSIYRTINVPQISGKNVNSVAFVSDALFDLDTLVEYMLKYQDVNSYVNSVAVVNENGNNLLYVDSADYLIGVGVPLLGFISNPIFPDGSQTKLYLSTNTPPASATSSTTTVYNLPGQLTCLECNNGFVNGIVQPPHLISEENKSLAYPNPSTDYIKIKYSLPPNFKHAFINLYDITGKLIKQKEIDGQYDDIYLSTEEIRQGAYSYAIVVDGKRMTSGKIIKL